MRVLPLPIPLPLLSMYTLMCACSLCMHVCYSLRPCNLPQKLLYIDVHYIYDATCIYNVYAVCMQCVCSVYAVRACMCAGVDYLLLMRAIIIYSLCYFRPCNLSQKLIYRCMCTVRWVHTMSVLV